MLTYLEVHLYYTLPPTIILYLLLRPVLSNFDKMKVAVLCTVAVAYTTPWDNYIIYHKAWWYRKDAVIGTIGYVPIEEYMFFIIQTVFTTLWTSLCNRWTMNALHLRQPDPLKRAVLRYGVMGALAALGCWGWLNAIPATKTFYLGSIAWWALLVVIVIWFLAGTYIVSRLSSLYACILVPTVYLCYVDVIALRAKVWHINEATSLELFLVDDLPIEEIIFFLVTNVIVALGSCAFDKSKAIIDTYFKEPFAVGTNISTLDRFMVYLRMLLTGALTDDTSFDPTAIDDLENCIKTLKRASKSFSLAANLFPNGE